ncbi:MAG: hypothetical protein Q9161_000750 [Pseudevernia consocians]
MEDIGVDRRVGYTMTAADTDVRQVEKMFAVNVLGPMRMVHHFHKMLVRTKGVVVNIGSANPGAKASYNASKAALHHYGNTLRAELKPFGVRVVTVISGEVGTNILKGDKKNGRKLPDGMSVITRRRIPSALSVPKDNR